jgi:hypothetical protein
MTRPSVGFGWRAKIEGFFLYQTRLRAQAHYAEVNISGGNENEKGDTLPDGPFRSDVCDIYIVNATPAYMGQIVFE